MGEDQIRVFLELEPTVEYLHGSGTLRLTCRHHPGHLTELTKVKACTTTSA
jgi:hypothetical protein